MIALIFLTGEAGERLISFPFFVIYKLPVTFKVLFRLKSLKYKYTELFCAIIALKYVFLKGVKDEDTDAFMGISATYCRWYCESST